MSRGHGRVQRAVLDYLESLGRLESGWSVEAGVHQIAGAVFATDEPTSAHVAAVRRACKRLADEGLVKTFMNHFAEGRTYEARYGEPFTGVDGNRYQRTREVRISETYAYLVVEISPEQQAKNEQHLAELFAAFKR